MTTNIESSVSEKNRRQRLWDFTVKWWPAGLVLLLILLAILDGLLPIERQHTRTLTFLLDGAVALAIVLYVIHTADLARSSRETAEANRILVESASPMILEKWLVREKGREINLVRNGTELSKDIYVTDKNMSEDTYNTYLGQEKKRVLFFTAINSGTRPVVFQGAKLQIADSRGKIPREISVDPDEPMILHKDRKVSFPIIYEIEGEISARITEIAYQDGDRQLTKWIANPYNSRRYIEPERAPAS